VRYTSANTYQAKEQCSKTVIKPDVLANYLRRGRGGRKRGIVTD